MFIEGFNYVPGTVLNTLCALTHLMLSTTLGSSYSYHLHCVEWKLREVKLLSQIIVSKWQR